ncbi:MAG: membrane dipeptidase [Gemmatimonadetes bacterium]|nr:membrane dipeptidase [Gemmatimonadota bacterium]
MIRIRRVPLVTGVVLALLASFFFAVPVYVDGSMNRLDRSEGIAVTQRAHDLHATLAIGDLHDDLLLWDRGVMGPSSRGHTDVTRLARGNVAVQVFSTVTKTPKGQNYERNSAATDNITLLAIASRWPPRTYRSILQRALYQGRKLEEAEALSDGRLMIVRSGSELRNALARRDEWKGDAGTKPVIGILNTEGLQAIEGRIENIDTLFAHGFRMAGLAHFFDNEVAGSAHGEAKGGLTPLGRDVLRRMEDKGMLVDLAHSSPAAFAEALALAMKPVVVSHGGVQATCAGPRNLTDDQLRALAANGALIGIGFWDGAICGSSPHDIAKAIRHAIDIAGLEHVALGSDWDGATTVAVSGDSLVQVTQALLDSGFTEAEIRAVMGENLIRFLAIHLP